DRATLGLLHPAGDCRQIVDGIGIRHAADGCKAARRRRSRPRRDGLLLALAGFTQMHVEVNESRRNDQLARVEYFISAADLAWRRDLRDHAIAQKEIALSIHAGRGIYEVAATNQQR